MSKANRANRNRRRGKQVEKRLAKKIGGISIGTVGGVDVLSERFAVEVKSRQRVIFDKWFIQLKEAVRRQKQDSKIPIVVCHISRSSRYYVIIDLDNFLRITEKQSVVGDCRTV